jgi:hypothetical protein
MKRSYTKHGKTGSKIHEVWKEMHRRCKGNYPRTKSYKEKKISVCEEWVSAAAFIEWAENNGYAQGLQLDRIKNYKGYSPENCRFVTPQMNANNKENTIYLTHNNQTKHLLDWQKATGIKRQTIRTRISRGWTIEKALTQPTQK